MTCPDDEGLFNKAVVQSAMIWDPCEESGIVEPREMDDAEQSGMDFFEYLGVKSVEEARKLDAVYVRDKFSEYMKGRRYLPMPTRCERCYPSKGSTCIEWAKTRLNAL